MNDQQIKDYKRIEQALIYIVANFKSQPDLEKVAAHLGLSYFHFQRLFTNWAGLSPKKFLHFVTVEYAKDLLKKRPMTLFDVADQSGLSGTGRLHDMFVNIEGMTPGEYKSGGSGLVINYAVYPSLFGKVFAASTPKGLCKLNFIDKEEEALKNLQEEFYGAVLINKTDVYQKSAISIFNCDWQNLTEVKLHLKGTEFQLKVWQSLLQIPSGQLSTYGKIADSIKHPKAARAVGTAIGDNPVAFLIPCHRVVQASGNYGEYRWGSVRKKLLIGWEAAQTHSY